MNDLANSLLAQGCYAEAEELYRIVLRTRRRVLGHEHPRTLDSTMALAQALRKQSSSYDAAFTPETNGEARDPDQPSESQSLCAEAIDGRRLRAESVNASAGDFASYAAAVLLCEAEGPRNSEAALAAALRAVELTGRSDADLLDTLAVAYHRTGQSGLAVESLREALALVPSNPSIFRADIESRLGAYLVAEGHFAEAEPLLIGNFTWIAETVQAAPHKVKEHADRLYELYEAWDVAEPGNGYAETAARWRKQTAGVQ
jgi:tetratricopeptide (TPR) repeat protein